MNLVSFGERKTAWTALGFRVDNVVGTSRKVRLTVVTEHALETKSVGPLKILNSFSVDFRVRANQRITIADNVRLRRVT